MSFETNIKDGIAILRVTAGRLDAYLAPEFKKEVNDIVEGGTSRIMVDLQEVSFVQYERSSIRNICTYTYG